MVVERQPEPLSDLGLARLAVDVATDHQAEDVVLLDIHEISGFADYFVICNGTSQRQIGAIADAIEEALTGHDHEPSHIEGTPESGWILLDYGSLIIHVFSKDAREFYRLERLWADATTLVRLQ